MAKLTEEQRQQRATARARREALACEERHQRDEERRQRWRREGMYLSWDEYKAGVPCRGCGQPLLGHEGDWPSKSRMADGERDDVAEKQFQERHGECREGRWLVSGCPVMHCSACCPPPPMGPKQVEELAKMLFASRSDDRKKELDVWKLTLTCEHVIERTQHRSHSSYSMGVTRCSECEVDRGVVLSERIGPLCDQEVAREPGTPGPVERERLAAELAAAEAKLKREQKNAAATRSRIDEIRAKLATSANAGGPDERRA
ncbi:hypothetical protein [Kitasatospora kazusensis]